MGREQPKAVTRAVAEFVGVGSILASVIVPSINGTVGDIAHIAAWVVLGADLIWQERIWLGRMT